MHDLYTLDWFNILIYTWYLHDIYMINTWYTYDNNIKIHDNYMICSWYKYDIYMIFAGMTISEKGFGYEDLDKLASNPQKLEFIIGFLLSICHFLM